MVGAFLPRVSRVADFRMDLSDPPGAEPGWRVVEMSRDELRDLPQELGFCTDLDSLDRVAPEGWRCFVGLRDGEPVHQSFVRAVPSGPRLFRSFTARGHRGRGAFQAVVRHVAAVLASEGREALYSACDARNHRSRRAHEAAGFQLVDRRLLVTLRGRRLLAVHDPLARIRSGRG